MDEEKRYYEPTTVAAAIQAVSRLLQIPEIPYARGHELEVAAGVEVPNLVSVMLEGLAREGVIAPAHEDSSKAAHT